MGGWGGDEVEAELGLRMGTGALLRVYDEHELFGAACYG